MQELDEIFKLYILKVDTLSKVKKVINMVIIYQKQAKKYFTKDVLFDIFSLANQLYQSQLTFLKGLKPEKIYFLENLVLNLLFEDTKVFEIIAKKFNLLFEKKNIKEAILNETKDGLSAGRRDNQIDIDLEKNMKVNDFFFNNAKIIKHYPWFNRSLYITFLAVYCITNSTLFTLASSILQQ